MDSKRPTALCSSSIVTLKPKLSKKLNSLLIQDAWNRVISQKIRMQKTPH